MQSFREFHRLHEKLDLVSFISLSIELHFSLKGLQCYQLHKAVMGTSESCPKSLLGNRKLILIGDEMAASGGKE